VKRLRNESGLDRPNLRLQRRRVNSRARRLTKQSVFGEDDIPTRDDDLLSSTIAALTPIRSLDFDNLIRTQLDLDKNIPERKAADAVWRAIYLGILDDRDTLLWTRWVAAHVVNFVIDDKSCPEDRPKRALKAIKLRGQGGTEDHDDDELDWADTKICLMRALAKIDSSIRPASPTDLAKDLKKRGLFPNRTVKSVADLIRKRVERQG
jgi:hypothetical protein